jgi:hypothetical protein
MAACLEFQKVIEMVRSMVICWVQMMDCRWESSMALQRGHQKVTEMVRSMVICWVQRKEKVTVVKRAWKSCWVQMMDWESLKAIQSS